MKQIAVMVVVGLALALVAVAAAEQRYSDPSGDAVGVPDITSASVSNDGAGVITFRVTTVAAVGDREGVFVAIDADKNPGTGFLGWEYLLSDTGQFGYVSGPGVIFDFNNPPPSLQATKSGNVVTISISRTDLGDTNGFGLQISALGEGDGSDSAPDDGWFIYDLVYPQCSNAKDDDGDGTIDSQDLGCSSTTDDDESDDPVTIKLGKAKTVPARPKAGKIAVVSVSTTRIETRQPLDSATVKCTARIVGGKPLKGIGLLVAGRAQCKYKLPADARNTKVRGQIAVTHRTATANASFTFRTAA